VPEFLDDVDATKPDDWNEDEDGTWEAPSVKNPDFKGEWKAPNIPNPAYKGVWQHPQIDNPEYTDDPTIGVYHGISHIAVEIWQVKSGSLFGGFYIGDNVDEAMRRAVEFENTRATAVQDEPDQKNTDDPEAEKSKDEL